ncbi:T9SS type A sorting domain-containing protein [Fulvivirgaceae bacterium PWU5]|uniref:T9SS type A sorting domain-containing protein n=1 Tax=Dawidia cretensis TaxID=2782350 RepID=A0AAP2GUN8_9BACT|nr:glycoside hydrolase family 97 catalytic domain-containing protein [Dawidia cretensis]MBT1707772.1 T9SS type A sorting domain-containing protein [Dawidia cretensis]
MKIQIRFKILSLCLLAGLWSAANAQEYDVTSPDGSLMIHLDVATDIQYAVEKNGTSVIASSPIGLTLSTGLVVGSNATVKSTATVSVDEPIERLYGKNDGLRDHYNQLRIDFEENYSLIVRAYDEGVAYRFETALAGNVDVMSEEANFNFAGQTQVIFPEADSEMRSWERSYNTYASIAAIDNKKFSITPAMFSYAGSGIRVVVAESDLLDYPGLYLQPSGTTSVKGKWAYYPKTVSFPDNIYEYHRVIEREAFLARTAGTRKYPWRVVIVSTDDKTLLTNELVYKLATPSVLTNTDWIKPGKSAWEWWHDAILETTQIPSGTKNLNLALYKFYVDFAAQNKLEYVTLDAGWSTSYIRELCQYAASKNVKIFTWDFINLPVESPGRLAELKSYGIVGIKVDLIERDDQVAINWFEQLAKACAQQQLMIIFHGCAKPTGLQRKYPNIVNFEAVRGAECTKWDDTPNPDYHLQFPFIRMLAGPLDYTPGSMRNVRRFEFQPIGTGVPMTIGTRTHEVAMYVMFDQPLAYLCDAPTEYRKYTDILSFLSRVPTVWDQTLPLAAEVGKYAVIARKHAEEWYVGAMTNYEARDIEVDFSFLPEGVDRVADVYRDTPNSEASAKAYQHEIMNVTSQSKLTFHLASGGGLAIRVRDVNEVTSIGRSEEGSKVSIFQNSDRTRLTVRSKAPVHEINITDISGRVVQHEVMEVQQETHAIDTTRLGAGIYVIYVSTDERVYSSRIIR